MRAVRPRLVLLAATLLVLAAVAGGCGGAPRGQAPPVDAGDDRDRAFGRSGAVGPGDPAPELTGLGSWYNTTPTTIRELAEQRRVVLVDFWTYTCVNCLRTLPFLQAWQQKYGDHGLTILGVHAPEFDFERDPDNVRDAVLRNGLTYAVAQDNEMATWKAFRNNVWPAKYLLSRGIVLYSHFGEGEYDETERMIRDALVDAGWDVSGIPVGGVTAPPVDPRARALTRELYGGYERNYSQVGVYAGQEDYYLGPDRVVTYTDAESHRHERWYLQGVWRNERESIVHARSTQQLEDYLALRFVARSVNVVMRPAGGRPYEVVVTIDGRPLLASEAGADVVIEEGRSIVRVTEARMYGVVALPASGDHELKLSSNAEGFAMFAVTFGNYVAGA